MFPCTQYDWNNSQRCAHAHTNKLTHMYTHTRTHAHTRTHIHTKTLISILLSLWIYITISCSVLCKAHFPVVSPTLPCTFPLFLLICPPPLLYILCTQTRGLFTSDAVFCRASAVVSGLASTIAECAHQSDELTDSPPNPAQTAALSHFALALRSYRSTMSLTGVEPHSLTPRMQILSLYITTVVICVCVGVAWMWVWETECGCGCISVGALLCVRVWEEERNSRNYGMGCVQVELRTCVCLCACVGLCVYVSKCVRMCVSVCVNVYEWFELSVFLFNATCIPMGVWVRALANKPLSINTHSHTVYFYTYSPVSHLF